jgi:hypothetical protein
VKPFSQFTVLIVLSERWLGYEEFTVNVRIFGRSPFNAKLHFLFRTTCLASRPSSCSTWLPRPILSKESLRTAFARLLRSRTPSLCGSLATTPTCQNGILLAVNEAAAIGHRWYFVGAKHKMCRFRLFLPSSLSTFPQFLRPALNVTRMALTSR